MSKKKTDHIIIHQKDYELECLRCGERHKINTPTPVYMFLAESEAFEKRHKDCLPCRLPAEIGQAGQTGK